MAYRLSDASSAVNGLIKKSVKLSSGPPAKHHLYTTRTNLDEDGKIRKWTFGQKYANMQNKTVLLVGETGAGKTTLINTMVNYFLGVKFEEKVWFEITEEEKSDQTESQTSEVTVYEIVSEEKLSSLTIIDTPGYGDTRGLDKDMEIPRHLHQLFLNDTGVKELDAVCLVLKASQNRISEIQRYIFEGVLSLFGKDIQDIIVLLITHSDGGPPTNALKAVKKEKIPCCYDDDEDEPVHFLFNNRQSEKQTKKYEQALKSSWEMGERSMEEFFEFLESRQRKSLAMTVSVLEERMQLEACVMSLKERIEYREVKQKELTVVQDALKQNKDKIEIDKNISFTVRIAYKEKVNITDASWRDRMVTSCSECQENCHEYGCWATKNARWCKIMNKSHCTVCKCHYSKHVRESKKYVTNRREEKVTFDGLKKKYSTTNGEEVSYDKSTLKQLETEHRKSLIIKEMMTNLEIGLKTLLAQNEEQRKNLVKDAYNAIIKLSEIALKPDSVFTIQYLDFLIPRVEEVGTAEMAQRLKDLQKAATKESTNPVVEFLSRMQKPSVKALANSVVSCFDRMKKDKKKATPTDSTNSTAGHADRVKVDMWKTASKESSTSIVGSVSKLNKDRQNARPKESTNPVAGYASRKNNDMRNAAPKESNKSAGVSVCMINNNMQDAPPEKTSNLAVGYLRKINNDMHDAASTDSTAEAVGSLSSMNKRMQNAPPNESANIEVGHVRRVKKDILKAAFEESTTSPVGHLSRKNTGKQSAARKYSNTTEMGNVSRMREDFLKAASEESTTSPLGYLSRKNTGKQSAARKYSNTTEMGNVSRMKEDFLKTASEESTTSPVGHLSRINMDEQNTAPNESATCVAGNVSKIRDLFSGK